MTNKEAIEILRHIVQVADTSDCGIKEIDGIDEEAIDMAIKALEQEPKTGHWIYSRCDMYECSKCGMTYTDLSCGDNMADYCPYCGSYNGNDDNENCD